MRRPFSAWRLQERFVRRQSEAVAAPTEETRILDFLRKSTPPLLWRLALWVDLYDPQHFAGLLLALVLNGLESL